MHTNQKTQLLCRAILDLVKQDGVPALADRLGINPSHIYNLASGKRGPSPTLVKALRKHNLLFGWKKRHVRAVEFNSTDEAAEWDALRSKHGGSRKDFGRFLIALVRLEDCVS